MTSHCPSFLPRAPLPHAPKVARAQIWGKDDKRRTSLGHGSDWSQVDGTHDERVAIKKRLGKNRVVGMYSFGYDAAAKGLHFYARMEGGTPKKVILTFDCLGDNAADDTGFTPDDVVLSIDAFVPAKGGNYELDRFIPFSELKGFDAAPGARLPFAIRFEATAKDEKGVFPVAVGSDKNGIVLVLPE